MLIACCLSTKMKGAGYLYVQEGVKPFDLIRYMAYRSPAQ